MIGKPQEIVAWLFEQDKEKLFDIKEHRAKRSLTVNAYAWALLTELANVMRTSKEEMYLQMVEAYGQSQVVLVLEHIDVSTYFKYYERLCDVDMDGETFAQYRVYKGSSEYDTREMAIFIDGVVSECQAVGIETLPPDEAERLKERWCNGKNKKT